MKHRISILAALAFVAACGEAPTDPMATFDVSPAFNHVPGVADAPSLSDDFNSGLWNPALEDHDNKFVVYNGMIQRNSFGASEEDRNYVRTVASGYNDSDFTAELLIRVGPAATITFFGMGAGEREGIYNEPQGAFFRIHGGGLVGNRVDVAVTGGSWVEGLTNILDLGDYPAKITKSGNQLTFEINGASATVPMPASLDGTNSRIYFGGSNFYSRFDDLNISAVPYARNPITKDDCKNGGWAQYGFRNQGLCIQYVNTGKDSR